MNGYFIPKATLGRLPQYLQYLKSLPKIAGATISATAIAKGLSLGDVQVRKDLAAVSGAGKPKVGYELEALINDIERHLGYNKLTNAVLVGAGKLGRALLDYDGFEEYGVRIIAGFDLTRQTIGNGNLVKEIYPIDTIEKAGKITFNFSIMNPDTAVLKRLFGGEVAEDVWAYPDTVASVEESVIIVPRKGLKFQIPRMKLVAKINGEFSKKGLLLIEVTGTVLKPKTSGLKKIYVTKVA